MSNVIDFTSAFLSRRNVVKVKCDQKPNLVKITGAHLPHAMSFGCFGLADQWLKSEGYSWVVGSNGFWAKKFVNA